MVQNGRAFQVQSAQQVNVKRNRNENLESRSHHFRFGAEEIGELINCSSIAIVENRFLPIAHVTDTH